MGIARRAFAVCLVASQALAMEVQPALQPAAQTAPPASTETAPPPERQAGGGLSASGGSASSLGVGGWISRGRARLSLGAGLGSSGNNNYALVTAGAGYFLLKGLEAGLDGEAWLGNEPQIYKLTPGLRYVFPLGERLFPYLGGFYRRVFYSNESPLNSVGGRAGAYVPIGGRVYAGGGVVYEKLLDCEESRYQECHWTYPEVSITFSF